MKKLLLVTAAERLVVAVEDVADQLRTLNDFLERFMEMTLADIGNGRSGRERFAMRTLPITD
jgi:hypothetical protein